ncbi:MAG: hypothetical protein AAFQ82_05840 [Myxococcota bacterium]
MGEKTRKPENESETIEFLEALAYEATQELSGDTTTTSRLKKIARHYFATGRIVPSLVEEACIIID